MKIAKIITHYLKSNRRLIVPQLGAFIVKSPEEVIFSEMLKRDDGVLRSLLVEEGLSELEAAGAIDRFIFELKHGIEGGAVYQLPGLGLFSRDGGIIIFRFYPSLGEEPEPAEESAASAPTEPTMPAPEEPAATPQPAESTPAELKAEPQTAQQDSQYMGLQESSEAKEQTSASGQQQEQDQEQQQEQAHPQIDSQSASLKIKSIFGEHPTQQGSSSHPRHADPSIKGLKYGSEKASEGFSYSSRSRRPDTFIILALAAIILAVGAMVYAYLRERSNEQTEQEYIEQMVSSIDSQAVTAETTTTDATVGENIEQ